MPITLPDDKAARQAILEIGGRMYQRGFVAANDGNISCKTADGAVWATPSGVSKGFMREEDLVKMSLDGQVLLRGALPPSSESGMHLRVYRENPDVGGVAHAHPPLSTAFAVAGQGLDAAVYPEAVVTLGVVPCLPYATPGTPAVAEGVAACCRAYNAVLLGSHGPVAWGRTLLEAFYRLEAIEHYAALLVHLGLGPGPARILTEGEVAELIRIRERLGITTGGVPRGRREEQG